MGLSEKEIEKVQQTFQQCLTEAAGALGSMINIPVVLRNPIIEMIEPAKINYLFGLSNKIILAIHMTYEGKSVPEVSDENHIPGHLLVCFNISSAYEMVGLLTDELKVPIERINEVSDSVLGEIANIFNMRFLTALSNFVHMSFTPSIPTVITYKTTAILDYLKFQMKTDSDDLVFLGRTELVSPDSGVVEGNFLFLPGDHSIIDRILGKA